MSHQAVRDDPTAQSTVSTATTTQTTTTMSTSGSTRQQTDAVSSNDVEVGIVRSSEVSGRFCVDCKLCLDVDSPASTTCTFEACNSRPLCEDHRQAHAKRGHSVVPPIATSVSSRHCPRHPDTPLKHYCKVHRVQLCAECVIVDHPKYADGHFVVNLAENGDVPADVTARDTSQRRFELSGEGLISFVSGRVSNTIDIIVKTGSGEVDVGFDSGNIMFYAFHCDPTSNEVNNNRSVLAGCDITMVGPGHVRIEYDVYGVSVVALLIEVDGVSVTGNGIDSRYTVVRGTSVTKMALDEKCAEVLKLMGEKFSLAVEVGRLTAELATLRTSKPGTGGVLPFGHGGLNTTTVSSTIQFPTFGFTPTTTSHSNGNNSSSDNNNSSDGNRQQPQGKRKTPHDTPSFQFRGNTSSGGFTFGSVSSSLPTVTFNNTSNSSNNSPTTSTGFQWGSVSTAQSTTVQSPFTFRLPTTTTNTATTGGFVFGNNTNPFTFGAVSTGLTNTGFGQGGFGFTGHNGGAAAAAGNIHNIKPFTFNTATTTTVPTLTMPVITSQTVSAVSTERPSRVIDVLFSVIMATQAKPDSTGSGDVDADSKQAFVHDWRLARVNGYQMYSHILGKALSLLPSAIQGHHVQTIPIASNGAYGLAVNRSETMLAVGFHTGTSANTIHLYSLPGGEEIRSVGRQGTGPGEFAGLFRVCFVPHNDNIIVAEYTNNRMQELTSATLSHVRFMQLQGVESVDCNGVLICAGLFTQSVVVLDYVTTQELYRVAEGPLTGQVDFVRFSVDSAHIYAGEYYTAGIKVFDSADGKFVKTICETQMAGNCHKDASIGYSGELIVSCGINKDVFVLDAEHEYKVLHQFGERASLFHYKTALALGCGRLYVLDRDSPRVQVFE